MRPPAATLRLTIPATWEGAGRISVTALSRNRFGTAMLSWALLSTALGWADCIGLGIEQQDESGLHSVRMALVGARHFSVDEIAAEALSRAHESAFDCRPCGWPHCVLLQHPGG